MPTWFTALRHITAGALDALAPQTCAACGAWIPGECGAFCGPCGEVISAQTRAAYCRRCGRFAAGPAIHADNCAFCRREHFWNAARVACVGEHRGALRDMVVALKHGGDPRLAHVLGGLLAEAIRREPWGGLIELLVPVPMHRLRRWQRPCNHAFLLADETARRLRLPVREAAVRRIKHTMSQTQTGSAAQRFANVSECFGPSRRPGVAGKSVCIVDNLITSGATVCEMSKVLRRAGAKHIYAAVVSRAVLGGMHAPHAPPVMSAADGERPDADANELGR